MLDFLIPKTKVQAWAMREVPVEAFEVIGIGQINPYYHGQYDNEIFITVVNFSNGSKDYDEREGLVLAKYFMVKRCPKCKSVELVPTRIKINLDKTYCHHEEEIAFDAFEEYPTRRHAPSMVEAFCNGCSACFEMKIKLKDIWVKQAKKIKDKDLITPWEEFSVE